MSGPAVVVSRNGRGAAEGRNHQRMRLGGEVIAETETAPHDGAPLGTGDNPGSAETTAPLAPGTGATGR